MAKKRRRGNQDAQEDEQEQRGESAEDSPVPSADQPAAAAPEDGEEKEQAEASGDDASSAAPEPTPVLAVAISASGRPLRSTRARQPIKEGHDEDDEEEDDDDEHRDEEDGDASDQPQLKKQRRSTASADSSSEDSRDAPAVSVTVQWVQCDQCAKWRKSPADIVATLPDTWHCALNTWDVTHASCSAPEESEQEDEDVWPGLPPSFLDSRERQDFYFSLARSLFSSSPPLPFPQLHGRPIDLYAMYVYAVTHPRHQKGQEYWLNAARALGFPLTEHTANRLSSTYRSLVKGRCRPGHSSEVVASEPDESEDELQDDEERSPRSSRGIGTGRTIDRKRVMWTHEEDEALRKAIDKWGIGKWTKIAAAEPLLRRHTPSEVRNRWRGFTRDRKSKLKVVSAEELKQKSVELKRKKEMGLPGGGGAGGAGTGGGGAGGAGPVGKDGKRGLVGSARVYPVNILEMREQRRYSRAAGRFGADYEDDDEELDRPKAVDSDEADDLDEDKLDNQAAMFFYDNRHASIRLSPAIILPLATLRWHLVRVLRMSMDSVLRLLKDMWEETDEEERRRLLSDAVLTQLTADERRPVMLQHVEASSTHERKKELRAQFDGLMRLYQDASSSQPASATHASAPVAAKHFTPTLASLPTSATPPLAPLAAPTRPPTPTLPAVTPLKKLKQYALPRPAVSASPPPAAPPAPPMGAAATLPASLPVAAQAAQVVYGTPHAPRLLPPYSAASTPLSAPSASSVAASAVASASPFSLAIPSPSHVGMAKAKRSLASPSGDSPSSAASSPSMKRLQRGPYFTARKRQALQQAQERVLQAMARGSLVPVASREWIDDRAQWGDYEHEVMNALLPGRLSDFCPPGVRGSVLLRFVDTKPLEESQKQRARARLQERRQQTTAARPSSAAVNGGGAGLAVDGGQEELGSSETGQSTGMEDDDATSVASSRNERQTANPMPSQANGDTKLSEGGTTEIANPTPSAE